MKGVRDVSATAKVVYLGDTNADVSIRVVQTQTF